MKKLLYTIILTLVFLMLILVYGRFVGTIGLDTKEIVINDNISTSYEGLKIVHFSDLHYKKVITEKRIEELIDEINSLNPDIVVFTGDLLDEDYTMNTDDISFLIKSLSEINSKYGNYSIMGDNDYLQADTLKNIYIQSDFTLLDNNYSIIKNENNDNIFIGGVNSYSHNDADIDSVMEYFNSNNNINYKLILVHEPDYMTQIMNKYDNINLVLAGHSLNGSINIPAIKNLFLEEYAVKYYKTYYKINNTYLYISNGIGVSNINFRLFNHPSINLYRIRNR